MQRMCNHGKKQELESSSTIEDIVHLEGLADADSDEGFWAEALNREGKSHFLNL